MQIKYILLIISLLSILSTSCKRNKITKKDISVTKNDSTQIVVTKKDTLLEKKIEKEVVAAKPTIKPASVDFKYLKIRSKAEISLSGEQQSVNLTANIRKDSLIWLSLGLIGIEGGRGIITRDSIIFLDRLRKNYIKLDFASLSQQFNFNLNFDIIQAILVGNMPINNKEKYEFTEKDESYLINQDEKIVIIENYFNKANLKLEKVFATDSAGKSKMNINYANFISINDLIFPQEIKTLVEANNNGKLTQTIINLQYNKIEPTNQNPGFSFSIPKSFTPMVLKK